MTSFKITGVEDLAKFSKHVETLQRSLHGKSIHVKVLAAPESMVSMIPKPELVRDMVSRVIATHHRTIGLPEKVDVPSGPEFHEGKLFRDRMIAAIKRKEKTLRKNYILANHKGVFRNLNSLDKLLGQL